MGSNDTLQKLLDGSCVLGHVRFERVNLVCLLFYLCLQIPDSRPQWLQRRVGGTTIESQMIRALRRNVRLLIGSRTSVLP